MFPRASRQADIDLYDAGSADAPALSRSDATVTYLDDGARDRLEREAAPFGREEIGFDVMGRHWLLSYAPTGAQTPENQIVLNWLPIVVGHRARARRLLGHLRSRIARSAARSSWRSA